MKYSKYLSILKNSRDWPALAGSTPSFPTRFQSLLDVDCDPSESRKDSSHLKLRELLENEMGFGCCEYTMGASQAFFQVLWHFSHFYNSLAIESPYYEPYFSLAQHLGFKIETFDCGKKFSQEQIKSIKKSRIAVISNPHFFHATLMPSDKLAEMCRHFDYVILDEVFKPQFSKENIFRSEFGCKNIIRINSLSKSLGLSSLRFGWISGPSNIITELRKQTYYLQVDIPTHSQRSAYNVLSNRAEILDEMKVAQFDNRMLIKKIILNSELQVSHNFDTGHFGSIKYLGPVPEDFPMLKSTYFGKKGYFRFRIDVEAAQIRKAIDQLRLK